METQTITPTVPQIFHFNSEDKSIEILTLNDEPWFVAKDICDILGLDNTVNALQGLEEDEKLTLKLLRSGQNRDMWIISESGMYNLIFRSYKPEAKVFRKWVTSEVLPAIRKTGSYELAPKTNSYVNPRTLPFIDATNIPYDTTLIENKAVRRITVDDVTYFSINDIQRAINAATCSINVAKKLNRKTTLARKILIFGNTHPAWFCTQTGVDLIIASSRVLKAQSQNAIN